MRNILVLLLLISSCPGSGQFLSNLHATSNDALFTTYAAPISRSSYKLDQGYQLMFNDPESGVEMVSSDGPNFGLALQLGKETRFRLKELFRDPIITTSYSDILKLNYYPFEEIRVDVCFDVYSSGSAFAEYTVLNSGKFGKEITLIPYHFYPAADSLINPEHDNLFDGYYYSLLKKPDSWMKEHKIPIVTSLRAHLISDILFDSLIYFSFRSLHETGKPQIASDDIRRSLQQKKMASSNAVAMLGFRTIHLKPGESARFRIALGIEEATVRRQDAFRKLKPLLQVDPVNIISEDEKAYSRIPQIRFPERDREMLYWSCFSLMRQCMMPAEGECRTNYYIFSREPKWGWGYGGQVFHESLSMLAYAYMDPVSAMNSQRVFIQRQQADGYINYRTGPYLDETIPYDGNGAITTSAPWFNYINWEVYKITKDRKFLQEAYASGKKFYMYFVRNRDSNKNGLCEWGGEGELESVRDARVVIWDNVSRPMNFEGPDVNSMLVKEARSLAEMARALGLAADARQWDDLAGQRSALIEHYMWDNTTGFYYNINKITQGFTFRFPNDLKVKEIIGFLPLWAGVSSKENAAKLMISLRDPVEFRRKYGIPTLTAKSPFYNPAGYWNGPVWVQWNYLICRGLRDYGYTKDATEITDNVLDNMIWHLKHDHVFWEFYSPDERQAGWNKTYIWAGIAARMLLDENTSAVQENKVKEKLKK